MEGDNIAVYPKGFCHPERSEGSRAGTAPHT